MINQCSPVARVGLLVSVFVLLWSGSVVGQDQGGAQRPAVGSHSFTETVDVPSPFVRSFIRNRLGAGMAFDFEIPPIEIGGEPISGLQGDLLFAILDFEYQYAIKDWIAIRARVLANGRLGSDTLSLLSEGVTMATGFEFGWLVRLRESEKTAFSLDLNLANRSFTGVNISRFVDDIIADAQAAKERGVFRYCMVASGRGPNERQTDQLCRIVKRIKDGESDIEVVVSLYEREEEYYVKVARRIPARAAACST